MTQHYEVLVIGAGSAGIPVAARLRRAGVRSIAVLDPADTHYYQPLWTLVGGGRARLEQSARPMASVMPKGVTWVREAAVDIDPAAHTVLTSTGTVIGYDRLVVAPGIQLDWDRIPGMTEALATPRVSSNYDPALAPKTWERIAGMTSGTAVFAMPSAPIKCAGAPQKIAYLAADHWRRQGVLGAIRVIMVLPTPGMFGVPVFARELEKVVDHYGIEVRFNSEITEIHPESDSAIVTDNAAGTKESIDYDFLHVVPPQSAPDWLKATPLAAPDNPGGYVDVDKHTLQHVRHPEIFALGDAGSTPNSKTGAAIRKQAPVLVDNLLAARKGAALTASYDGYASCPLTTARDRMLLAEFDYSMQHAPSLPLIDTTRPRYDMWLLKRHGLPAMYWNLMLKGRA